MRYLVFYGYNYYPAGGWEDFGSAFDSLEEAREYVKTLPGQWVQIVDLQTMEEVE